MTESKPCCLSPVELPAQAESVFRSVKRPRLLLQPLQRFQHIVLAERPLRFLAGRPSTLARNPLRARHRERTRVIALLLHVLRQLQHMSQALVVHDRALVHFRQPVIGGVGQGGAISPRLDPAIWVVIDVDVAASQLAMLRRVRQQVEHLVVLDRQALGHAAWLAPREDQIQILVRSQRSMGVVVVARHLGKARVVVGDELRHEAIGRLHGADATQAQLLDQPVLQGQVCPFHAAFCLAAVGADAFDVQFEQGPRKLRMAVAASCSLLVDPENAGLVTVKRHRLAVALQVGAGRREVRERGLRMGKAQLHDPADGVVDINEQRAGRRAFLKPAVIAAINLNQFAIAGAPITRLIDLERALFARYPQAGNHHQPPDRFLRQSEPVCFAQLLGRQGRAEVGIVFPDQAERCGFALARQTVVAGSAALARDQPGWAFQPVALQ
ncbi:transposase [Cupriavidus taiwanensis]|nr:transposase [Cupriavidus taiwanensis]